MAYPIMIDDAEMLKSKSKDDQMRELQKNRKTRLRKYFEITGH